eukprot:168743_1
MELIESLKLNEWVIHGKVYNLESFIAHHPGGSLILNTNRKRDCSELFESYHFISKKTHFIQQQLKQYYVRDARASEIRTPFVWNDTQYIIMKNELRHEFISYFDKNNITTKATTTHLLIDVVLLAAWILTLYYYFKGYYWTWFGLPVLGWLFSTAMIHNGLHYAMFKNTFWNEFVGTWFGIFHNQSLLWYYQHNISHHSYTNVTDKDIDLEWHEYLVQTNTKYDKSNPRFPSVFAFLSSWSPLFMMTSLGPMVTPFFKFMMPWQKPAEKMIFLHSPHTNQYIKGAILTLWFQTLILLVAMPIILVYQLGVIQGLMFFLIPRFIHGVIYYLFTQMSHINEHSFQNHKFKRTKNFIVHQILSCSDYCIRSEFIGFVSVGLSNQGLHHIIPSVHPCHYPKLSSILQQFCHKHNIQQSVHKDLYSCFRAHFRYLLEVNIPHVSLR